MQAGVLLAGLDGMASERDPGKRLDIDVYAEGHKVRGLRKVPFNLLDALRLFEKNKIVRAGFGAEVVDSYVKLKTREWNSVTAAITPWIVKAAQSKRFVGTRPPYPESRPSSGDAGILCLEFHSPSDNRCRWTKSAKFGVDPGCFPTRTFGTSISKPA